MSVEEFPAFSIWKTFNETIPALMSSKPNEKNVEHLAKIIKSGDYTDIFVYNRDPTISFDKYQNIADKFKSFTIWFLGRLFYLLSCENLKKSHNIYIEIQLCILKQLSQRALHVYNEMAQEYSKALIILTEFIKSRSTKASLDVFIPVKYGDMGEKLDLSPVAVEIHVKNWNEFLLKLLKIIAYILNQSFAFHQFDSITSHNLDNLLFLLTTTSFEIKLGILNIYIDVATKLDRNSVYNIRTLRKMDSIASCFEQIIYEVYNKKLSVSCEEMELFEALLTAFLKHNESNEQFIHISHFLVNKSLIKDEIIPAELVLEICKKDRIKPVRQTENFENILSCGLCDYNTAVLCGLKADIINDLYNFEYTEKQDIKIYGCVPGKWSSLYQLLLRSLDNINCDSSCQIENVLKFLVDLTRILICVCIDLKKFHKVAFVQEDLFFLKIICVVNQHFVKCEKTVDFALIFKFFVDFCLIANSRHFVTCYKFFSSIYSQSALSQSDLFGTADHRQYRKEINNFFQHCTRFLPDRDLAFYFLNQLISRMPFASFNPDQISDMESVYWNICKRITMGQHSDQQVQIIKNLPHVLTVFSSVSVISNVLNPALSSSDEEILKEITRILPKFVCMSTSNFIKLIQIEPNEDTLKIDIYCEKCHLGGHLKTPNEHRKIEELRKTAYCITLCKIDIDVATLTSAVLTNVPKFLTYNSTELKLNALEVLPHFSSHILKFYSVSVTKIWAEKCGDKDANVRRKFGEIVAKIIQHGEENTVLSREIHKEVVEILFNSLTKFVKKSLQESDYESLQETILYTIQEICNVKCDITVLPTIKILLYFIMIPSSKHSLIAVNKVLMLAEKQNTTIGQIYIRHKNEICATISHLCIVNHAAVGYSLATSLCKISLTLKFYSSKDFVSRECHHLLPFFVSKAIKTPSVGKLIEEMALMVNSNTPEFLSGFCGNIFLHVFLNETRDDFKHYTTYLERSTGLSGSVLCKRNQWLILSELLLNFHDKREKVLWALQFLATEDSGGRTDNLQEYLQTRFLGLLKNFDLKLMGKITNRKCGVMLSLADLFKYMGPKHIGPLRFKVIAMLRTVDCEDFPDRNCDLWDAFIRSCDVESLAPQLATICVSLLPLIKTCPVQINGIFKYLVIDNENHTKEFIKDLFLVDDPKIDKSVVQVIKKYVNSFEDWCLRDKMKMLLRYLTHETSEIRIRSLKQLKLLMEKNREELDQMILGYNGIDPMVVELIDILTLGCREKDPVLKLACGEVIGELGAVEPSHLPRRYAQSSRSFTFFLSDDSFIVNALNELTKALQGEKNTVNMDRFAVAIQEILKTYEISSSETSRRNDLWKQFPESQQELMLPLLSSRYIITEPTDTTFACPIYGSQAGASFQSWLYNWTRSLIATLSPANQTLLTACLPAMKQDNRVLMQFLPHILLHSIIDDSYDNKEKSYLEMKAVTRSFVKKKKVDQDILDIRPVGVPNVTPIIERITPEEARQKQCTRVVFVLLDFLDRWTREWQWTQGVSGYNDRNLSKIKSFLQRFCKLQLARCNYHCGEYPRALMYLEDYITENSFETSRHLTFLAEIYAQLDEPDGVAGVTALQPTEPSIQQRILALEISGKLSDAAACYERIAPPLKLDHLQGLIQCYLDLDNVNTALNFAQGALDRQPEFDNMLLEMQAEPLWRLGRYEDLDALLRRPQLEDNNAWGVQIGKALLSFQNGDRNLFNDILENLKSQQVELLGATSLEEGSYQHGYGYISSLHALNELQQVEKATYEILSRPESETFVVNMIEHLTKEWMLRMKVVQESVRIVEPLLCLRRVAIEQSKRLLENKVPTAVPLLNSLLGECWESSVNAARTAGLHQQAYSFTLKAEEFSPPNLFLVKAKLHWMREEHEFALTTLKRGVEVILPEPTAEALNALSNDKRRICAEAKLLIAQYNDSISNVDTDVKTSNYKEAVDVYKEWETGWVYLAQFFDRRFQNFAEEDRDTKGSEMQIWMIYYFSKSLRYGTAFVYQSLPRLLSIWFDYGTRLFVATTQLHRAGDVCEERKRNLLKMTKLIDTALERLPAYVFLTAFSQLVSRICHPQKEVYKELKSIIIKVLLHYPQQTLWMIISVIKSGYAVRAKRCAEIFSDSKLKTDSMTKLVRDFTNLAEKLIELCNKQVAQDVEKTTVSSLLRTLPRLLNKPDFSEIMIPTHKFRKLVLPNPDFASGHHNPFPNHYVHIVGIQEEVTLLRSLQRPRKITFRGSDGKGYIQMLKPKDDLRKDFRLMEFNDIVNQLLSREPESRQRRLNIRLYSVAPLNEECGLIEWIPNLVGLRPVLQAIYKQQGSAMTARESKEASCNIRDPLIRKREVFTKVLLPRHPPVLGQWFRRTFPDAQSWVFSRTAYIRTTAVISIVGYILGLGDRHGENILFDSNCGDTVHVDFNCLFNKGEAFEWPERVPFRLTQNMVTAMGPLGVEGVFRKSCACTLKVLRDNSNTLMSIVTPFVYDPLVSWPRNVPAPIHNTAERTNEQAVDHVKNIELRLQGIIVKTRDRSLSIPLSIDGQTNRLINEAMDLDNLCQMYIGWGPHL